MDKVKIKEALEHLATELESDEYDDNIAYYSFLLTSSKFENKWFSSLDEDVQKKWNYLTPNIVHALMNCLSEFKKEDVKKDDFDLYFFAMDFVHVICNKEKIEEDNSNFDYIFLCIMSVFKMWYNDIKKQDVIDYYRGISYKDFPNMKDVAYNCKWAQDNGINCTDISSMFSIKDIEISKEGEEEAKKMIERMTDLFMNVRPLLKGSFKNWDDQFVEDHLEDCKVLYLLTNIMFAQIPKGRDAKYIMKDEEKVEAAFKSYMTMCAGEEYKIKFLGEDFKKYANVFEASYMLCLMQSEMKAGMFSESQGSFYEEMTNMKIESLENKKLK